MEWGWILLVATVAVIVIIIIVTIIASLNNQDSYNYNDVGTYVDDSKNIPSLTPANDRAGMRGEEVVNYHLRSLLRQDEYLLANLLLPLKNGHQTEIDCIIISRKGIFCIETKNLIGHISGNDEDEYWLHEYNGPYMSERRHKNPVKQNENHCNVLKRILNRKYEITGAVIFANLEDGRKINSEYTYTIEQFKNIYRELDYSDISTNELNFIYRKLLVYVATPEQLKNIEMTLKRFITIKEMENTSSLNKF